MIWVYAICDRPEIPPPRRRGLAQAPLDGVVVGPLLAVVTRHVQTPGEPAVDALWVHERVIDRLMADHTVLPTRFGSRVEDESELRAVLRERRDAYLAALARVRGSVELGVRALRTADDDANGEVAAPEPAPATGRDYLLGKLRDGRRADQAALMLHEPLAALAVDSHRQSPRTASEVLRASYLVDRVAVARFRLAVQRLQAAHPDVAILCTGPWPPYSFVGLGEHEPARPEPLAHGG